MIALFLALAVSQGWEGRESLGVFDGWAAFRDASPRRCYAIAQPVRRNRAVPAAGYATIATWPDAAARNQLHVRLSRPRREGAAVTLTIGERRFQLVAGPQDAWAPDARTDAAIVAAIRSGRSMSIETAGPRGAFADTYALKGAATAIDAAGVGCVARG